MDFLFSPNGRFRRWQYWFVMLVIPSLTAALLYGLQRQYDPTDPPLLPTRIFAAMIVFTTIVVAAWCCICATIKRYHDQGVSGWWWLVAFIPVAGPIWQLIECGFLTGEPYDNVYGQASRTGIEEDLEILRANRDVGRPAARERPQSNRDFGPGHKPLFGGGNHR